MLIKMTSTLRLSLAKNLCLFFRDTYFYALFILSFNNVYNSRKYRLRKHFQIALKKGLAR
jgi:hypothetical protein